MSSRSQSPLFLSTATLPDDPDYVVVHNDSSKITKIHFDELHGFMGEHLANEPHNSRSSAREKLTRLTNNQFQELTVDVYDELIRRNNEATGNEILCLPVRVDFHPLRNLARQKLAILPESRFKDLVGDVLFEFGQRYPEFQELGVAARPHKPHFLSTGTLPEAPDYVALHIDSCILAKIHFDELQRFRGQDLDQERPNSRASARAKLTRLTKLQFQELTVDVYDELIRRNNKATENETPFSHLSARDDFHPRRNQARQNLSTLARTRFKDLASDVLFELRRRYPEFHKLEVPTDPA